MVVRFLAVQVVLIVIEMLRGFLTHYRNLSKGQFR